MEAEKKKLSLQQIQTILLAGILVILLVGSILLAVQVSRVAVCLDIVEQDLQALSMDDVNEAVDALTEAANQLAAVDVDTLNQTATALRDAAENLKDVDIDTLNETIASLKGAADTLKDIDIDALNGLVGSLDTVAEKLQNAVNAIAGIIVTTIASDNNIAKSFFFIRLTSLCNQIYSNMLLKFIR